MKTKSDLPALALVWGLALSLALSQIFLRPDLTFDAFRFLLSDQGVSFHVADALFSGKRLYADVDFLYGRIPIYLYVAAAKIFGNKPSTYVSYFLALSLLNLTLAFFVLRRFVSARLAACVSIFGAIPTLLVPGSRIGAFTDALYGPLERALLLLLVLLWVPSRKRSIRRAVLIGTLLGVYQGVKFGGAFLAGLSLLLVDLFAERGLSKRAFHTLAISAAAFFVFQGFWILLAFATLPHPLAMEKLWPMYLLHMYQDPPTLRNLLFNGSTIFFVQQLTPFSAALLAILGGWAVWKKRSAQDAAPLFLVFFFAIASFVYFKHVYHFNAFYWVFVIASILAIREFSRVKLALLVLVWLPCFLMPFKVVLFNSVPADTRVLDFGEKGRLWGEARFTEGIEKVCAELGNSQEPSLLYQNGAGLHHFCSVPSMGRVYWFLPQFIRPYDERDFMASIGKMRSAVVFRGGHEFKPTENPATWDGSTFPRPIADALMARLGRPREIGSCCWIFPSRVESVQTN